jgi:hypothetical protein
VQKWLGRGLRRTEKDSEPHHIAQKFATEATCACPRNSSPPTLAMASILGAGYESSDEEGPAGTSSSSANIAVNTAPDVSLEVWSHTAHLVE